MKETFGVLPSGEQANLYTITCAGLSAAVSDYGATLVKLMIPDRDGHLEDVILGYDDCNGYRLGGSCIGGTVGRNANRVKGAEFTLGGTSCHLSPNEGKNNLHSGPDFFFKRMWNVANIEPDSITLSLRSPNQDQGFPGNADIRVTYALTLDRTLRISYEAVCDADTVFNLTNHSYFNLAGHQAAQTAMEQLLTIPGRYFTPDDAASIPTGELCPVEGTPMDFRTPKTLSRDIEQDYEPLLLQGGYDHNYEVFCNPCAILTDPVSGRTMSVYTDCPGIQLYSGNFLNEQGKNGAVYARRSGVALETQYYPDCLNHPQWKQPITKAGEKYRSVTTLRFTAE